MARQFDAVSSLIFPASDTTNPLIILCIVFKLLQANKTIKETGFSFLESVTVRTIIILLSLMQDI